MDLTFDLYFGNYRIMEREWAFAIEEQDACEHSANLLEPQRVSILDSALIDPVLTELKRQAPAGCVLCSFDALDDEEWD